MSIILKEKKYFLSIKETAEYLGVSSDTIRRAIKSKSIKAFQINNKGNWKVPIQELRRLNQELVFQYLENHAAGQVDE